MSTDQDIALAGYCPVCGQGRQLVAREHSTGSLYVLCEDCESEWDSPDDVSDAERAHRDTHGRSSYVTIREMQSHSWSDKILNKQVDFQPPPTP
jgi:hypothetical protein